MIGIFAVLAMVFLSQPNLHAAEKIRIGFPELNSSTFTLPMADIKGCFQEEGAAGAYQRIHSIEFGRSINIE